MSRVRLALTRLRVGGLCSGESGGGGDTGGPDLHRRLVTPPGPESGDRSYRDQSEKGACGGGEKHCSPLSTVGGGP